MENPEDVKVTDKAGELRFVKAIEWQIAIWLHKNKTTWGSVPIHTFFLNKCSYYSALALGKKVSCGWYLYGPYLRNYSEEYQDQDKLIGGLQNTLIQVKITNELISEKTQKLLTDFFEHYVGHTMQDRLYSFLKYIYEKKSNPFPIGKKYYLAKLECNYAIHSPKENISDIERVMTMYQKELCRPSFADAIELHEEEIKPVINYGDLVVDSFERRMPPEILSEVTREFSATVTRIPALRINIHTGHSYDAQTESRWRAHFRFQLKQLMPMVSASLKAYSKRVYVS